MASTSFSKKIIHIDMDCFYAAIEIRDNPHLQGKPVAVGGKAQQRGVLTTCNYEARKFGLHSAMSTAQALKRCPHLVLLPVNMPLYRAVSQQIHQIFKRYTPIIEPLSLDEAYLDVTDSPHCSGSATWIAAEIRQTIWNELRLTASAGIAPLKFLAKIASDQNKPNGQFVITPDEVATFIYHLPLRKIPGVGKVTQEKLVQLGLEYCSDIQHTDKNTLLNTFGKLGQRIWDFSHGNDPREVVVNRARKSLAVENTLLTDIEQLDKAKAMIEVLFNKLCFRLERNGKGKNLSDLKKLGVKLKFDDFSQTTLEKTVAECSLSQFLLLFEQIWQRKQNRKIRLIGLSVHFSENKGGNQLSFWE